MRDIVNGLLVAGGEILLARRSAARSSYADTWSFPGGHVETGETLEAALVRELGEEIGVRPTAWRALERFTYPAGGARFHFFAVEAWEGEVTNLGTEHNELRWVGIARAHEMPDLTFPVYAEIFRALAEGG